MAVMELYTFKQKGVHNFVLGTTHIFLTRVQPREVSLMPSPTPNSKFLYTSTFDLFDFLFLLCYIIGWRPVTTNLWHLNRACPAISESVGAANRKNAKLSSAQGTKECYGAVGPQKHPIPQCFRCLLHCML